MLHLASYDIVFQEVPGEVTLALNLSACPNRCPGCHSPHLKEATGELLDDELLDGLLVRYGGSVTCVAFMGGDGDPAEVSRLAARVHAWRSSDRISPPAESVLEVPVAGRSAGNTLKKVAWYSGRDEISAAVELTNFDFIKLGPYDPVRGGLSSPGTNQRFYRVERGSEGSPPGADDGTRRLVDATRLFWKNS